MIPAALQPYIGIVLFLITLTTVLFLFFKFLPSSMKIASAQAVGPFYLHEAGKEVIEAKNTTNFYEGPNGSFQTFLYLNPMNRTGAYTPCTATPVTNPNQPSCSDGTYAPCPCGGTAANDCTDCQHTGYATLLSIAGIATIEVITAPDASRQKRAMTQLVIRTKGPALTGQTQPQTYIETLILPTIPFQQWIMLTISREGRRFDVYYNDKLVSSQKTMYMPINTPAETFGGVLSGSTGLAGQIALLDITNAPAYIVDVETSYNAKADTRGTPYLGSEATSFNQVDPAGLIPTYSPNLWSFTNPFAGLTLCPEGGCFQAPAIRPPALYDIDSPVA